MADQNIPPDLAEVLNQDSGIFDVFGMSVDSAEDGVCRLRCVVPDTLVNAGGFAHGSIAFSLMDTAAAYAIRSLGTRGVTSNANVTYVRGGQGGSKMHARVEVISRTRRVASLRGEVYVEEDGEDFLAAHGSFVFQLRAD